MSNCLVLTGVRCSARWASTDFHSIFEEGSWRRGRTSLSMLNCGCGCFADLSSSCCYTKLRLGKDLMLELGLGVCVARSVSGRDVEGMALRTVWFLRWLSIWLRACCIFGHGCLELPVFPALDLWYKVFFDKYDEFTAKTDLLNRQKVLLCAMHHCNKDICVNSTKLFITFTNCLLNEQTQFYV